MLTLHTRCTFLAPSLRPPAGKFVTLYKRAAHRIVLAASGDLIVRPSRLERTVHETFGTSMAQHFMTAYGRR